MKNIIILLIVLLGAKSFAQNRYLDRKGKISFYSEAPMENIEAHNNQAVSIIDIYKKEVAVSILMRGFKFEKALMQEHFNEKYIESDKYPKAIFSGKIIDLNQVDSEGSNFSGKIKDLSQVDFSENNNYRLNVVGKITLHGVTQPLNTSIDFSVHDDKIITKTKFNLRVKDFNIKVPKIVINNIAEVVEVSADFVLEKQ